MIRFTILRQKLGCNDRFIEILNQLAKEHNCLDNVSWKEIDSTVHTILYEFEIVNMTEEELSILVLAVPNIKILEN